MPVTGVVDIALKNVTRFDSKNGVRVRTKGFKPTL